MATDRSQLQTALVPSTVILSEKILGHSAQRVVGYGRAFDQRSGIVKQAIFDGHSQRDNSTQSLTRVHLYLSGISHRLTREQLLACR